MFRFIKLKINIRKTERPHDERHDKTDERQLPGDESGKTLKDDPGETERGKHRPGRKRTTNRKPAKEKGGRAGQENGGGTRNEQWQTAGRERAAGLVPLRREPVPGARSETLKYDFSMKACTPAKRSEPGRGK